jgi:ATP-dependent helicase/nuclease subunit A
VTLTPEQQSAAHALGSVAVVAGAGTGKTHMLTERYLHHLTDDGLSPLQIVAVTFTDRAADELRARIRRAVRTRLTGRDDHDELLAELEAAQISTIHALCARICREHPDEAGVPPDFEVLDELRGALWTSDRLSEALGALDASLFTNIPFPTMSLALESLLRDPLSADQALGKGPETWEALFGGKRNEALAALRKNGQLKAALATLEAHRGPEGDRIEETRRQALVAASELMAESDLEASVQTILGIKLQGGSKSRWGAEAFAEVKDALKDLRDAVQTVKDLLVQDLGPADERLSRCLPDLREAYRQVRGSVQVAKRRARLLDFADLEVHALQALEHEDVRAYYRERWQAFLIDEFQDTNPVQADVLDHLTAGITLTIVGDEKQSIYGFRRADVTVFRAYRARILKGGGGEVVLARSFRTHHALVDQVNRAFAPALGALHQALEAERVDPPHDGPHIGTFAVSADGEVPKDQLQRAEAVHIARRIRELLDLEVKVHDVETNALRPVRPGDIAILSRAWAPLGLYGEALAAAGIPAVHAGGGSLLATREAKDGYALLRFLADPTDNLALIALLRGPFFGVDDTTLHRLAGGLNPDGSWWRVIQEPASNLAREAEVLGQLLSWRKREAPSSLLALADYLTGYTAVLANLPGGERRETDWRDFLALVADLEVGNQDVFTVARWLLRLHRSEVEVPRSPIEAGNAVSLMTVHGAKGLEWPVVVVPDLARGVPPVSDAVLFDPAMGVALKFDALSPPHLYKLIKAEKVTLQLAEMKRVFYVALTRARDYLLLSTTHFPGLNVTCGFNILREGLKEAGVDFSLVPLSPEDTLPPELPSPMPMLPPEFLIEPLDVLGDL